MTLEASREKCSRGMEEGCWHYNSWRVSLVQVTAVSPVKGSLLVAILGRAN